MCIRDSSTVFLVALPAASGDIAADDALQRKHVQLAAHHALAFVLRSLEKFRHIFYVSRDHMVWKNVLCVVKPEFRHLGQNSTFLGNSIMENHIKAADAVGSDHDQAIAVVIDFTDVYKRQGQTRSRGW